MLCYVMICVRGTSPLVHVAISSRTSACCADCFVHAPAKRFIALTISRGNKNQTGVVNAFHIVRSPHSYIFIALPKI